MNNIELTGGYVAQVDSADVGRLSKYSWRYSKNPQARTGYAVTTLRVSGKRTTVRMHRMILDAPDGFEIDHKNGDGLDNRRDNLRVVTHGQNACNRRRQGKDSSRYKGVSFEKKIQKFRASIRVNRKKIHLGCFECEIDAAMVYDRAAKQYFGEYANLNLQEIEARG